MALCMAVATTRVTQHEASTVPAGYGSSTGSLSGLTPCCRSRHLFGVDMSADLKSLLKLLGTIAALDACLLAAAWITWNLAV